MNALSDRPLDEVGNCVAVCPETTSSAFSMPDGCRRYSASRWSGRAPVSAIDSPRHDARFQWRYLQARSIESPQDL
jgi:hypothetical protein